LLEQTVVSFLFLPLVLAKNPSANGYISFLNLQVILLSNTFGRFHIRKVAMNVNVNFTINAPNADARWPGKASGAAR
jgi:hypothetical protein